MLTYFHRQSLDYHIQPGQVGTSAEIGVPVLVSSQPVVVVVASFV